jgi:hypothetical protein
MGAQQGAARHQKREGINYSPMTASAGLWGAPLGAPIAIHPISSRPFLPARVASICRPLARCPEHWLAPQAPLTMQTRIGSSMHVLAALLAALLLAGGASASRPLARLQPGVLSASSQAGPEGEEELNLRPLIGVVSQVRMGGGKCMRWCAGSASHYTAGSQTTAAASQPPPLVLPLNPAAPPPLPLLLPAQLGDPAPKGHSYIASSYVKMIESAGARAVPILCDMSADEVKRRFKVGGWVGGWATVL